MKFVHVSIEEVDMSRKFIIIAKSSVSSVSGPSRIVQGLIKEFQKEGVDFEAVLLEDGKSKIAFIRDVVSVLRTNKRAIVNVHTDGFMIPLMVYFFSKIYRNHNYYLTAHGINKIQSELAGKPSNIYVFLERLLYKNFPNIICVSKMQKSDMIRVFGRKKNTLVIPNATEANSAISFEPNESIRIIFLGGLIPGKGIRSIISFAEQAKKKKEKIVISVFGSPLSNKEWFEKEVAKKELIPFLEYNGKLECKQSVYDEIRKADAQFCFSLYDTYNVAIAESLALGCPCVATDRCGAAYLINDGENGLIINLEKEEESDFINVFNYLETLNYSKRMKIETDSKKYLEMLSWSGVAKKYLELQ